MPISRPILIALVAAVLALVGFYATQGSRDSVDSAPVASTPPPAVDKSEPPTAIARADESRPPAKRSDAEKAKPDSAKDVARPAQAKADTPRKARAAVSGPVAVRRAIARHRRVVLFFGIRRGADDQATAVAAALQRQQGVLVVLEPIGNLARYRTLIGGLGISQAPAIVIVGKDGAARLVEGFVDPATLAQEVADAG